MAKIIPFDKSIAEGFKASSDEGLPGFLGIKITDVSPGTMTGRLNVREELLTRFGNLHGGVLSALCDHMLGCVCYPAMQRRQWAATTEFKINLTAPITKGSVVATASIINLSQSQAVVRIDVVNEDRIVAIAQGTVTIRDPR